MAWNEGTACLAPRGKREEAVEILGHALQTCDRKLLYSKVVPYFETLRNDPKFQALMTQIRL